MVECSNCGNSSNEQSSFCGVCGNKLKSQIETTSKIDNQPNVQFINATNRKHKIGITHVVVVFILTTISLFLATFSEPDNAAALIIFLAILLGLPFYTGIMAKKYGQKVIHPAWTLLVITILIMSYAIVDVLNIASSPSELVTFDASSAFGTFIVSGLITLPFYLLASHYLSRFLRASYTSPASRELFWLILLSTIVSDLFLTFIEYNTLTIKNATELDDANSSLLIFVFLPLLAFAINRNIFSSKQEYMVVSGDSTTIVKALNKKHLTYELNKLGIDAQIIAKKLNKYAISKTGERIVVTELELDDIITYDGTGYGKVVKTIDLDQHTQIILLKEKDRFRWLKTSKDLRISLASEGKIDKYRNLLG